MTKTVIKKRKDVVVGECYRFVDRDAVIRLRPRSRNATAVIRCEDIRAQETEFKRRGLDAVWGQSEIDYASPSPDHSADPRVGELDVEMLHHYATHPIPTPIEVSPVREATRDSDRHLCDLAAVRMLAADASSHGDLRPISNEERQAWSRELARKVKASDEHRATNQRIVVENDEDYFA